MGFKRSRSAQRPSHESLEGAIEALEALLDARLPVGYRDFLREYGRNTSIRGSIGEISIDGFYSPLTSARRLDLHRRIEAQRDELPDGVIPIALCSFGDELCLTVRGDNHGKVYLWSHEESLPRRDPRKRYPGLDLGFDYQFKPDDWPEHPSLTLIVERFEIFWQKFSASQ